MKRQTSAWVILLLVVSGTLYFLFFTYQNAQRNKESVRWVNHTHEVIETVSQLRACLYAVESQDRGYVITGNEDFLNQSGYKNDTLHSLTLRLQQLTADNPQQTETGRQLEKLITEKLVFQNEVLRAAGRQTKLGAVLISGLKGKHLTDSLEARLRLMQEVEQRLLSIRQARFHSVSNSRYLTTIVVEFCTLLLVSILLVKTILENRLRRRAEEKARLHEQRYENLIDNSALVLYTTNKRGCFTHLSGKCKDITGFTAEELIGERFDSLVEEGWRKKVLDFYLSQIEKRTFESVLEFPIISKHGDRRWVEQSVVLMEKGGRITGFQCIAKDITERKYAERLLQEAEQTLKAEQEAAQVRLQSILDNMPMIVYLKDLDGRFILVNKQFHEQFGTTDKEIIGQTTLDVHISEESSQRVLNVDEQVKQAGTSAEVVEITLTKKGERHMAITKFPLHDKDGRLVGISSVGKDITENIRYQQDLIDSRERAEKAERLQEEFLANMSHEIRTPMNGIIGMTNLLETTEVTGEQAEYLGLIQQSSHTLLSLINDILDLSKIKAGRMTVETIDFDLHQTLEALCGSFVLKAKEKGISLQKEFCGLPGFVSGDQHKLVQILNNLLSNAIKFTEKGAVTLSAQVEDLGNEGLRFRCSVSDTGIGITEENLSSVFESFVQAGNDTVRRFGGTGLGLAITKRLVELQEGTITVRSKIGVGTTFSIALPFGKSHKQSAEENNTPPQTNLDLRPLKQKRILLIEDNEVNQKVTYLMLHKAGMRVDIAGHGKEAIAFLESGRTYDLIITDLQMPEMDGFQTVDIIRHRLRLQTPIIAMTASALRNEKERCYAAGMNEYVAKPFSPAVLFFHLNRLLSGSGSQTEDSVSQTPRAEDLYSLQFLRDMEDEAYTADVLELFLQKTGPGLLALQTLTQQQEWDAVFRQAHSLKSNLGFLQMNRMLQTMSEIELAAKTTTDTHRIPEWLDAILQQYSLVKPMLEIELAQTRKNLVL